MSPNPAQFETYEKIRKGLGPVRWLRSMALFGLLFPVGLTALLVLVHKTGLQNMSFPVSGAPWTHRFWSVLFYTFVAGAFFSLLNLARVCPRCGNGFFKRAGYNPRRRTANLNQTGFRLNINGFSRRCLNCGLKLDGSNLEEE